MNQELVPIFLPSWKSNVVYVGEGEKCEEKNAVEKEEADCKEGVNQQKI